MQCGIIWTMLLAAVPIAIRTVEARAAIPTIGFPGRPVIALLLLTAFTALNVHTATVLVRHGHGTPLPLDCPREFVVAGPYRYVRNPMAIAGLGQGIAVALWLGSWGGLAYVGTGILIWQCCARPAEERDVEARFGPAFRDYRDAVRCWVPRLRPVRMPS